MHAPPGRSAHAPTPPAIARSRASYPLGTPTSTPIRRAAACAVALAALATVAATPTHATIAELNLSRANLYDEISLVGGKLLLSGGPQGHTPFPSARDALYAPGPTGACHTALVDPATLTLYDRQTGDCEDPRLYGVRAMVINDFVNGTPDGSHVRIARATPAGYTVGPVVMTYSEYSDTDAEWVYGDGWIWLFDPATTHGSELLRISQATGAVLQTVAMPSISRPLLAADDDGLWLAPAFSSGWTRPSVPALYHVAPGMRRPALVSRRVNDVYWMVAASHELTVDVNHDGRSQTLWEFAGAQAMAIRHLSTDSVGGETGYEQPTVVGDRAEGFWTVRSAMPEQGRTQAVFQLDALSGRAQPVASIPAPTGYDIENNPPPLAWLDGSLFVLDAPLVSYPAGTAGAVQGPSALFRVSGA